jgi:hypothetical protein
MKNSIVYRPHQSDIYFAWTILAVGILSFVALAHCLPAFNAVSCLYTGMGILSMWLAKTLFDSSQRRLVFEPEGIRLTDSKNNNHLVPWNKYIYAYFERNYKGHLFLVLSPQVLHLQQAKSFANQAANTSKVFVDNVCVIYLNNSPTSLEIEKIIKQTVLHVGIYQV